MFRLARRAPVQIAAALLGLLLVAPAAAVATPDTAIEDYAEYQPQTECRPKAKPGTTYLGDWLVRKYGGGLGPISRACGGGTSEHLEGRAFDWTLDASRRADRERARSFLEDTFRTDRLGNTHSRARRMGIMYLIWNDRMYSAWDAFEPEPYLSSSCRSTRKCSTTLRHRDHLHISLNRPGGRGETSWYDGRVSEE